MHEFCRAQYRIDRTGGNAFGAADTIFLDNRRDAWGLCWPNSVFSGLEGTPNKSAKSRMPSSPPGGHWLMSAAPEAMASA